MKPLAITCGDPAGVGPEIVAAWLNAHPEAASEVAVLGHGTWLETLPAAVTKIVVVEPGFVSVPGQPSEAGARIALGAMERAAAGCWAGEFSGVVTGPVSKDWLARIGYEFPGQTEFFAARWGEVPTMAFCGGKLRVVLLTWHIPFREVPARLTRDEFSRAVRAADELARAEPSDTLFHRQARGEFDVTVALYHDQGLAPLKLVDFDTAVNVTLGLPFVRTSPDHGTAFGIAGKGKASATSFSNAVEVARRLIARRAS